ncbi:MAG: hypothetical protein V1784_12585, partial [bacterium]
AFVFGKCHDVFLHSQSSPVDYEENISHFLRHHKVDVTLAFRDKKGHIPARIKNFHFLKSLVISNKSEYSLVSALDLLNGKKALYAYLVIKPNSEQSGDVKRRLRAPPSSRKTGLRVGRRNAIQPQR